MRAASQRLLLALLAIAAMSALMACKQSLYSNLSEREANEAFVALAKAGIGVSKTVGSDRTWTLNVDSSQLPAAVDVLTRAGLPRERFSNLGDMFKREGIVSTPTEERVRFLHGVSQELAQTLSTIDGVTAARVHLVVPKTDPLSDETKPSSASVFIKHRADLDMTGTMPAIKSLVLRSVEGLTHDTVYVSLFPAEPSPVSASIDTTHPLLGIRLKSGIVRWINGLAVSILALLLACLTYLIVRNRALLAAQRQAPRRTSAVLPDLGQANPLASSGQSVPAARAAAKL